MDQGVKYIVSLQDVNVVTGLKTMEGQAVKTEASIQEVNKSLRDISAALGIGFGIRELVSFGKDAIQSAADVETSFKRIKFASKDMADARANIAFINSEVDKFKIPLLESTDAYGKFLSMIGSTGMAGEKVRGLHDDLLTIAKVKGITDGQMNTAVMDLGKMIESGTPDARHLRGLGYSLNGIIPYIAKELNINAEKLSHAINKGHSTQIPINAVLNAITKQAQDLSKYLPEATQTIQSSINDIGNDWLRFKSELVQDLRPEVNGLFADLKEGVGWLRSNTHNIIMFGQAVGTIGKMWLEYKAAMLLVNVGMKTYQSVQSVLYGDTVRLTTATATQASAFQEANASATAYGATLKELSAIEVAKTGFAEATNMQKVASSGALGFVGRLGAATAPIVQVAVVAMAAEAAQSIAQAVGFRDKYVNANRAEQFELDKQTAINRLKDINTIGGSIKNFFGFGNVNRGNFTTSAGDPFHVKTSLADLVKQHPEVLGDQSYIDEVRRILDIKGDKDLIAMAQALGFNRKDEFGIDYANKVLGGTSYNGALLKKFGVSNPQGSGGTPKPGGSGVLAPNDKVTGQRVVTYNITIGKINGVGEQKISVTGDMGKDEVMKIITDKVPEALRDTINSIVNDSQLNGDK